MERTHLQRNKDKATLHFSSKTPQASKETMSIVKRGKRTNLDK